MKNNYVIVGIKIFLVMTVLTGLVYPLLITAVSQGLFSEKSNGSILMDGGKAVGSALIAQKFDQDKYFWGRPSAADYNPLPSGAGNLSATSKQLRDQVEARRQILLKSDPGASGEVPPELLYASGSGLDPHISPAAALYQVDRVMKARQIDSTRKSEIIGLIDRLTEKRTLLLLGEPRVNVLKLNLELDRIR